jgi:hypothetical protein
MFNFIEELMNINHVLLEKVHRKEKNVSGSKFSFKDLKEVKSSRVSTKVAKFISRKNLKILKSITPTHKAKVNIDIGAIQKFHEDNLNSDIKVENNFVESNKSVIKN